MAGNRLLVVDDEPDFLQLLAFDLKKRGYQVTTAPDGERALELALAEIPDLIILDIKMPKMDGYTLVRRLKKDEKTKKIPLIVLTSYEPMKDMFKLEGVEDYFIKTAEIGVLAERIEKLLSGSNAS